MEGGTNAAYFFHLYDVLQQGEFIAGYEEKDKIEANSMGSYDGVEESNDEVVNFQVDVQNIYQEVFHYRLGSCSIVVEVVK